MNSEEDSLKDQLFVLDGEMPEEEAMQETTEAAEEVRPNPAPSFAAETKNATSLKSLNSQQPLSPTLQNLPEEHLPPAFICMYCPEAMWLAKGDVLVCYCRAMSAPSYSTSEEDGIPVSLCDGPFLQNERRP